MFDEINPSIIPLKHVRFPSIFMYINNVYKIMSEKQFKTSDQRRAYQRNYYKLRQQKLIEKEKEAKITGGNILNS